MSTWYLHCARHWINTKSKGQEKTWFTHSGFVLRLFKSTGSLSWFTTCCWGKETSKLAAKTYTNVFSNTWVSCYGTRLVQRTTSCFWGSNSITKETWVAVMHYVAPATVCVNEHRPASTKAQGRAAHISFSVGRQGTFEYLLCTHRIFRSTVTEHQGKGCLV